MTPAGERFTSSRVFAIDDEIDDPCREPKDLARSLYAVSTRPA